MFNSTPHSWAVALNTRREISYLRAPIYFSLRNFLRIPFTADLMLTIFFSLCYLSPFKLLDILSEQFDMDICHICDYSWSGKFLIRFIHIGDSDIRLEMCNSHTSVHTFNLSPPLQINILILTRVIREMTRMQQTGEKQSQQLRWERALKSV